IPTPLQKFTNEEATASVEAGRVDQLLQALEGRYPGILNRLCDENGKLRRFLNVYVNSEDIRFLDNQTTALNDGDEVSIVPAVAGG
ncbi:MAG: MoaD/ThiS family protein, partial [Cyanobacteriota bacterium]